ncbi:AraC family transcriptional regulator [Paenibacillus sp. S150]|uniref:AraC family transcriptional regulator n=1 Tax=Paenibacillus sp. S150 TaxID=2749826 RepID=UPI001C5A528B|nr:helix-turn-helix domain-containing protein [Paenibacillus sp. S150]MBW4079867.1 AraC family transcriptional regulator [Paenibacillus sp. S150]
MIKLLIADDEALVCIGLQSMLKWEQFNIEIAGIAHNGAQEEQMIDTLRPDIVISDIKMPIKSGLEVAGSVRKKYGRLPLFIMLTSYEEFEYARGAIEVQATDYLVKLELTPEALAGSIRRAISILEAYRTMESYPNLVHRGNLQAQRDKFFIRLFNNLFENKNQYLLQKEDLDVDLSEPAYLVCTCRILGPDSVPPRGDKLIALCSSTVQMAKDTLTSVRPCYVTSLDLRNFAVALPVAGTDPRDWMPEIEQQLADMALVLHNYFNVTIIGAIGFAVEDPYLLRESYLAARKALPAAVKERSFVFFTEGESLEQDHTLFDFSESRSEIRRAFEEMDTRALYTIISKMIEIFEGRPDLLVPATDAACNILYMATSLLADGENIVEQIFENEPEGYRAIYQMHTTQEIAGWLIRFRDGCSDILSTRRQSYKEQIVRNVQEYIKRNLGSKLSLNQVADVFNFSPNYLSHLFSKVAKVNYVEYITETKIAAAKEMMVRGEGRIYEISQKLGYESAFYFSKVFKKVTGVSPRDYIQQIEAGLES